MGHVNAIRFSDSTAISLRVGGIIHELDQEVNAPTVFKLLDVSSNLLLFSIMPHNILVVKNPFHGGEHIIPLPAPHFDNESFTRPFHVRITPVVHHQINGFQVIHVKIDEDDVPIYSVYNSHTHAWTSKAATLASGNSNEGDQRRLIIMKAARIPKTVIFFKDVNGEDTPFFKRVWLREIESSDEDPDHLDKQVEFYCGRWVFIYDILSHEAGSWLVELEDAYLYRRSPNGANTDFVSEMPRGMHVEMPKTIRAVSFREIDGSLYAAFQTREINDHGFNVKSMNYGYAFCIATGEWVNHRVDHPIGANPNVSPPIFTNGLRLPAPAPPV